MNIVFCYITPFHPNKGGIGRVTDTLAREFLRRGHNIYYLIYDNGTSPHHEFDYPAKLWYLPSQDLLSKQNLEWYHNFLIEKKIDLVINQSGNFDDSRLWLNVGSSTAKRISVLHTYPTTQLKHIFQGEILPLRNNTFKERLKRFARIILCGKIKKTLYQSTKAEFERILPNTEAVVCLSKGHFPELEQMCPGIADKLEAIPNPNPYLNTHIPERELRAKKNMVLFTCLFGRVKREDLCIRIWKKIADEVPDWELVIVGYGDELRTKYLKDLASGVSNIRFVGYADPQEYQKCAKIACMTSVSEGWGMVLIEAIQKGCVPIAFDSFAPAKDIIQDGVNGFLIAPFDIDQYARRLKALILDEECRVSLAQNALKHVEEFDVSVVADRWETLFRKIINI